MNMKNEKELALNKELYNDSIIKKAVECFSELCSITLKSDEKYIYCLFDNCKVDYLVTMKEFENYILGYMGKYGD